jgi:hypothetical protein
VRGGRKLQGPLLGDRLVDAGVATRRQIDEALKAQRRGRGRLGWHLVRAAGVSPAALGDFLEKHLDSAGGPPKGSADVLGVLPARIAHLHNVYPLALDGDRLELGVPPAHGSDVIDIVAEATGFLIEPRILPAAVLRRAVERDYLGGLAEPVVEPPAGMPSLVVDQPLLDLRPVAPDLRTSELSSEAWLRSVIAEAVARGARTVEIHPGPSDAELLIGDQSAGRAVSLGLHAALGELLVRLSACPLPLPGKAATAGRCEVVLRGHRVHASVAARSTAHGPRWRLVLADQRLSTDEIEEVCAASPEVMDGIDRIVSAGGGGLLLACGPAGGGSRRFVHLLGGRLSEVVEGAVRVSDVSHPKGSWSQVVPAADDNTIAEGLHGLLGSSAPLVVVDALPGMRSMERALLLASRTLVVAALPSADSVGALAWLARQGFIGALKNGLLRALVEVLVQAPACGCAQPGPVDEALLQRFALEPSGADVLRNAGCSRCVEAKERRPSALLGWTAFEDLAAEDLAIDDEIAARRSRRERGLPPLLDLALRRAAPGVGGEMAGVERLLAVP